jgi:hypothetical protein
MPREQSRALWVGSLLGAFYLLFIVPRFFFRHDDWWILGNAVRYVPTEPGFLWRPILYFDGKELIWFFRPGFKAIVYAFYQWFGFSYAFWLVSLLALFFAALWLGFLTVVRLTRDRRQALWFIVSVCASIPIHLGSLAWIGEGAMNVPQLFLLSVCTYGFVRGVQDRSFLFYTVALGSFGLSFLFKESSVFHFLFLLACAVAEKRLGFKNRKAALHSLVPFALLAGAYLGFRLFAMPLNPSYYGRFLWLESAKTFGFFLAPIFLPTAVWALYLSFSDRRTLSRLFSGLRERWYYLPYFLVSVALYFGHGFFSPGWLLVVGVFSLMWLSLVPLPRIRVPWSLSIVGTVIGVVSLALVMVRLESLGWKEWGKAQRGIFSAVTAASHKTTEVLVRNCPLPGYPHVTFDRVVANEEGLRQMWYLTHGSDIPVHLVECQSPTLVKPTSLVIDWTYPEVARVIASP